MSDEKKGIRDMVQMGLQDKVEEDLRQRLHELEMLSQRDALTGLWNRNYLKEQVNEHLSVSGHHGVMFMMDLDNFKMINDIYNIGVYRSLGSSKLKIYLKYFSDTVVMVTFTSLMAYIIVMFGYLTAIESINDYFGTELFSKGLGVPLLGIVVIY